VPLVRFILGLLCRLYCRTLRIRLMLPDGRLIPLRRYRFRRVVFAHSEMIDLGIAPALLLAPFVVLLAPGRDGDRAALFIESAGCRVIRGSSLRSGATGLRQLINVLRNHEGPAALSVDGPIGPRGIVKPGIISCASHTGRPIVPLGAAATLCLVFRRSWSRIFLPLPGARVVIVTGADLQVTHPLRRPALDDLTRELAARLKSAQELAEEILREGQE
jgi:lysophospholipid acyltransferase (LPLAT)-like uncharacterized protein